MPRPSRTTRSPGPGSAARPGRPRRRSRRRRRSRFLHAARVAWHARRCWWWSAAAWWCSAAEPPGSVAKEDPIGRIGRLVHVGVAQLAQVQAQLLALRGRHLDACQHAAVIRTVIAVMEQADVPARSDGLEEAQQRAGTFRKLEAVNAFVRQPVRPARRSCSARAASPFRCRSCRLPCNRRRPAGERFHPAPRRRG